MVFTKIFLVRGVLIDRDTFFSMFKNDLKDIRVKHGEDLAKWDPKVWESEGLDDYPSEGEEETKSFRQELCEVMDIIDGDFAYDHYFDFLNGLDYLFPYPCCSDLAVKQWVIGAQVGDVDLSPNTILNTVVTLEGLVDKDEEWEAVCKKHSLETLIPYSLPRTYLMLDDCTYCS